MTAGLFDGMQNPAIIITALNGEWIKIHEHLEPVLKETGWQILQFKEFDPRDRGAGKSELTVQGNVEPDIADAIRKKFDELP